jgi:hypothetical protein
MRTIRNSFSSLAIIGGLIASLNFAHAQTTARAVQSVSAGDMDVMLQAVEATTPQVAESVPKSGTFYSAQFPTWPPLPANINSVPAWNLGDGVFLLSDLDVNYSQRPMASSKMAGSMMAMDVPAPGDGGDGGTNSYTFNASGFALPDWGSNLWIRLDGISSGNLVGIISNTIPDIYYELQSKSDLVENTQWVSSGLGVYGSEATNWTAWSVPMSSSSNLFVRIRSWETDGSGLPIWWQMQYFGTTGLDPFSFDPSGDGFTLWDSFVEGLNPTIFNTPAAPRGLTATFNADSTATVNWLPSPGPVTGYTVERHYYRFDGNPPDQSQTFNLSDSSISLQDTTPFTVPGWVAAHGLTVLVSYTIQAHYAGGDSAWSGTVWLEPSSSDMSLVSGPQGSVYIAARNLPAGTTAIRLTRVDDWANGEFGYSPSNIVSFNIPISTGTNGLYLIPAAWTTSPTDAYGRSDYIWFVQPIDANGHGTSKATQRILGYYSSVTGNSINWIEPPYFDGRTQLKQNLIFLLRAVTVDYPFYYYVYQANFAYEYTITNSATYVYSDFTSPYVVGGSVYTGFDVFSAFQNNYAYRNFVFSLADVSGNYWPFPSNSGHIMTGVGGNYGNGDTPYDGYFDGGLGLIDPPVYQFQPPTTSGTAIAAVLATNQTQWLCSYPLDSPEMYYDPATDSGVSYGYLEEIGVTPSFDAGWNQWETMAADARNVYGLRFLSAKIAWGNTSDVTYTLSAGSQVENVDGYFYPETAQPLFQTMEYDFWNRSPLPGSTNFSTSQASDLLIAGVDSFIGVNGYAKLAVTNGYPGVYAYLGQYFDQAYKKDDNGNVTTNTTGVLSPYGNFFATEPGPAALVTMPDLDTGARGTCTVSCVSLALNKSGSGTMDLSFSGPDATSQASPYRIWVNNGYIKPGNNGSLDQDLPVPPNHPEYANYSAGKITCQRDLENFFRLWVCGVPQLPVGQGYTVTLSMSPVSGNPAINLYYSCETNGGTGYLTDTNIAATQTGSAYYANALCTISNSQSYTLQMNSYGNLLYTHYLFEGAGIGEGQLTMTISQNGNTIAQTGVWLDLRDVKSLYQRVKVTPRDPNGIPGPWTSATTTFDENTADVDITSDGYGFSPSADESKTATVFVHGSNLSVPSALSNGDTMFKRLYWQGYHGRFALFYWNTLVGSWDGTIPAHYNYNEFRAFKYGLALKKYVENDLPAGYAKNVIGHSMGNMVLASALYPRGSTSGMTCRNVIFMQAAVSASCLDSGAATLPALANLESPQTTPDDFASQWGYRGLLATNVNATLYNIYNTNDFALGWWVNNQELCKPENLGYPIPREVGTRYTWDSGTRLGVLYYANGFLHRTVSDPQESMSFIARSRTEALGRMATGGSILQNQNVGDGTTFPIPFGRTRDDHSGEFTRPIQQLNSFYNYLYLRVR